MHTCLKCERPFPPHSATQRRYCDDCKRERNRERVAAERNRRHPRRVFESPHATVAATRLVRVERDEYVAAHMLPSVGANEYIASYGELGSTAMPASLLAAADDFEAKRAAYLAATHAAEAATIVRVVTPAPVISTVPIVSPVPVITITERLAVAA